MSSSWQTKFATYPNHYEKVVLLLPTTNLAFHDLTIGNVSPKALQSLLGLGVKKIPTPLRPMLAIDKSMEKFNRYLYIWSVFAGSEDLMPFSNPKIYIS